MPNVEQVAEPSTKSGGSDKSTKARALKRKRSVFEFLDTVAPTGPRCRSELEIYLDECTVDRNSDPLHFWRDNESRFPALSSMAKKYLAVPASSGDVERLFSIAGSLQRARRSRLVSTRLEKLLLYREFRLPSIVNK